MAFDEELATRVRKALSKNSHISEKRMFGGIAFFLNGNMCCGVHKDSLIVRLDPAQSAAALKERHTKVFDLTGRPMRGWIVVAAKGVADTKALGAWLRRAVGYVDGLPAK
jgi:TfoX/Sxy family transcriptional regulator of competence genes